MTPKTYRTELQTDARGAEPKQIKTEPVEKTEAHPVKAENKESAAGGGKANLYEY